MKWFALLPVIFNLFTLAGFAREQRSSETRLSYLPPNPDTSQVADSSKHKALVKLNMFLSGGVGVPLGKYSVNYVDYLNSTGGGGTKGFKGEGGFAEPGMAFNLYAEYPSKNSNWGFEGQLGYNRNQFNMSDYAGGYSYNSPVYYNSFNLMPGVFARFSDEKIMLTFTVSAGMMICQSPDLKYSGDSIFPDFQNSTLDTTAISRQIRPSVAAAFAFNAGIGIRFKIAPKWVAAINASYLQAFPTFNVTSVFVQNGFMSSSTGDFSCPFSLLNITLAVGYCIGN